MSIFDIERTATPGALDSEIVAGDRPLSAFTLRTLSRNANHLRNAPTTVVCASWNLPASNRGLLAREWRLVGVWPGCPVRPAHAKATCYLDVYADSGANLQFELRMARSSGQKTLSGAGSTSSLSWSVEHELGYTETDLELWVRAYDPPGAGAAVGTPTSWTSSTTTTVYRTQTIVGVSTLNEAEVQNGNYAISFYDSSGNLLFRRTINGAIEQAAVPQIFLYYDPLTDAEIQSAQDAISAGGWSIELDQYGAYSPVSMLVLGEP